MITSFLPLFVAFTVLQRVVWVLVLVKDDPANRGDIRDVAHSLNEIFRKTVGVHYLTEAEYDLVVASNANRTAPRTCYACGGPEMFCNCPSQELIAQQEPLPETNMGCSKCGGTGTYRWGAFVNGHATHSGPCYDCAGKGYMTAADRRRDAYYHDHEPVF